MLLGQGRLQRRVCAVLVGKRHAAQDVQTPFICIIDRCRSVTRRGETCHVRSFLVHVFELCKAVPSFGCWWLTSLVGHSNSDPRRFCSTRCFAISVRLGPGHLQRIDLPLLDSQDRFRSREDGPVPGRRMSYRRVKAGMMCAVRAASLFFAGGQGVW